MPWRYQIATFNGRVYSEALEILAVDGKTHRRTHSGDKSALHVVNVWASHNRLVLGQLAVDSKSNEITAVPELLKDLMIKGSIVTTEKPDGQIQKKTSLLYIKPAGLP